MYGHPDAVRHSVRMPYISRLDGLPISITYGALLARFARTSSAITAERRAFTAGFQAVLEDERKSLVLRLVVRTLYFGAFVLI